MLSIEERIAKQKKEQADDFTKTMQEKINGYFDLIVQEPISQIKKLPESTFVKSFLPYFCGENQSDNNSNVIGLWVGIAGSVTSKVHVVNDKDEIIFTVPPLSDTTIIDIDNKNKGQGFKNILQNYQLYANQTPASAEGYLNRTIFGRIDKLRVESKVFSENEAAWMSIFERYGKIKSKKSVAVVKKGTLDDDELLYD